MDKYKHKERQLNIIQWNANSLKPKLLDLQVLLNRDKIHIAVINETWLDEDDIIKVSGYHIWRSDREDSYGGVGILTHKSVKVTPLNISLQNTNIEVIGVNILNVPGLRYIIHLYCPPHINMTHTDWDQIFGMYNSETLITGDVNAHHISWSYKTDRKGEIIYKAMFEHEFICINDGNPTRIRLVSGALQQSSPDVSFTSRDIAVNIKWKTTNETLGSDHVIVKMVVGFSRSGLQYKKRNFKEATWKEYNDHVGEPFQNPGEFDNVQ
jgi:hypothetical protein